MVPDECGFPASGRRRRRDSNLLPVKGFFLFLTLLCSACSTLGPTGEEFLFSIAGRVGAIAGKQGSSADFFWRQYESGFDVEFWGPFGQGRTRLVVQADTLTVHTARGERISDGEARAWIRRELHLEVPIRALSRWITGRPAPEWPASVIGADGFNQLGWQVEIASWNDWDGRRLPGRLTASRAEYRVTIVCRNWTFR